MTDRELDAYLAEHLFGDSVGLRLENGEVLYPLKRGATTYGDDDIVPAYSSTGDGMLAVWSKVHDMPEKSRTMFNAMVLAAVGGDITGITPLIVAQVAREVVNVGESDSDG